MTRLALTGICALVATGLMSTNAMARGPQDKILEFDSMVGVSGPFTEPANTIRDVVGGGLPWVVESVQGELTTAGKLEIRVTGLVFAGVPIVPAPLRGTNNQPNFRAIVSCLTTETDAGTGLSTVETVNRTTGPFPATTSGDAYIEAHVDLPQTCVAPIIFVTNANGTRWFAATGM